MNKHNIKLSELKLHGQVTGEMSGGVFCMTVNRANPLGHCKPNIPCMHYVEVPGRFRLPLRIDIKAMIDVPSLYIMLGNGHTTFGNYFDNRRIDDIAHPQCKTNYFDNRIPFGKLVDISLTYDLKEMQVLVDDAERFHSKKEKYMRSALFNEMNADGFTLKISCDKRTQLQIASISVIEYEDTAGIEHFAEPVDYKFKPPAEKPSLEQCLTELPDALGLAITDINRWLVEMRPMKFKRQISTSGDQIKISYVALMQGFSYVIHIAGSAMYHTLQWYLITKGTPDKWGRKADDMENTLNSLAQTDSGYADRMFSNLQDCVGGYGSGCLAKTPYTYNDRTVIACHGKMYFNMNVSEFADVKRFIGAVKENCFA